MGNPDIDTGLFIADTPIETVKKTKTHRHRSKRDQRSQKVSSADYYARRFSVKLNPDTEIIATLVKRRVTNLAMAMTDPGDVILAFNHHTQSIRMVLSLPRS